MVEEKTPEEIENVPEKKEEAKDMSEKKEEKEFLARGEIKTMEKDVSALREAQAIKERGELAKIKTEEEIQREKEKQARASRAAAEREIAEKEAKTKEEELKRLRGEREKKIEMIEKEEIKKEEGRAEGFKEILKETQRKEEKERKRFLERVEAKAEEKGVPVAPLATPTPPPPLPPTAKPPEKPIEKPEEPKPFQILKKIPKPVFKRPSFPQKVWIRIVLALLVLAIVGVIVTFWYWYLFVRGAPVVEPVIEEEIIEEEIVEESEETLFIPLALIATEASQRLEISLLEQILKEELGENRFTRLIIKDLEENKVLGLREFFEAFEVKAPETFYNKVNNDFTLFIYSSRGTNRLGFVTEIKEADLFYLLKQWEETMEADFENFSVFLGKTSPAFVPYFRESAYEDTVFRYLSFPPENFGLCWAITDNYFILTFSGESMIKTIDKINE